MREIIALILLISWIAGVVLAKGFWLTATAILFCPYAWYLVVEKIIIAIGAQ